MVDTAGERARPCPRESSSRIQWVTCDRGRTGVPSEREPVS